MPASPEALRELARVALEKSQSVAVQAAARKLHAGKALSRREQAALAEAAGVDLDPQYVQGWGALADALGCDVKTLEHFRKRHATRIRTEGTKLKRRDSRLDVAAWRALSEELGELRGRGINNPALTPDDYIDERQLRLRRERAQLEKAEFELARLKESMLPVAEFEGALLVMVGQFNAVVNALPARAAGKIVTRARGNLLRMLKAGLPEKMWTKVEAIVETAPIDYADIEEILQDEADQAKRTLAGCEYLKPAAEAE